MTRFRKRVHTFTIFWRGLAGVARHSPERRDLQNPTDSQPGATAVPPRPLRDSARPSPQPGPEWWVEPIRSAALAVFIAIPIFAYFIPSLAGRIVWTVVVASVPLFIVLVGYHRWRRICPLAFFAQLPVRLRRPGTRRASPWLEANYYYVALSIFLTSLWLRLIATNGNGRAIAVFFVLLALVALTIGVLYTGKTWCNYICPVSFIEKIYTEPHGLRETPNSQCTKCTACKKSCPDINQENNYWKEIDLRPKRFVYFAFPGLVFGFYFYYYLQAGTWDYYFGGSWTNEPMVIHSAFMPGYDATTAGFFFLPAIPRALAALLTLVFCALLSFFVFSMLEPYVGRLLRQRDPETDAARVRHVMFALAAFTAFVTFYTFAGAPTLRMIPWAPHFFGIIVVLTATLFLVRRLRRTQQVFAEETLARGIIKRWEWADISPPKDLREVYLLHTIRSRETARGYAQVLEVYRDAVRETLANGFVTRAEVQLLGSLRNQLQIKKADHEKIMAALAEEERAMINNPAHPASAEKRLQLQTYTRALEQYLDRVLAASGASNDSLIRQLRVEYGVTNEEHVAVLDEVLGGARGIATRLAAELSFIQQAAATIKVLEAEKSPVHDFLAALLHRRRASAVERLMHGLTLAPDDATSHRIRIGLLSNDPALHEQAIEHLRASVAPAVAERLFAAHRELVSKQAAPIMLAAMLHAYTYDIDPYVRAVALYALSMRDVATEEALSRLSEDEHDVVRESALHVSERAERAASGAGEHRRLISIEKMIALRSVPIFASLAPEDLAELTRSAVEAEYAPDEVLCVQGEQGNEVFILLTGEVKILRRGTADETVVATEPVGSIIGEMAVLDPAPRSATVRAGSSRVRVLRLDGNAFRETLKADPTVAEEVIRTLARRQRRLLGPDSVDKADSLL